MTWFQAFRSDFGYSSYGEYRTSVTADIPLAAIVYTCILVSIATLVAAAGIRGKQRWYTLIRVSYSLAVGSVIAVSVFGYCWQIGDVTVSAPYIYRSQGQMDGSLGIRVGVKTVNITLSGKFNADGSGFKYNEDLILEDVLKEHDRLWKALDRGLPQPLVSVLDFFYVDAAGLRFGREVWFAGYIANILLWTSFAFWVASNVLLCSVIWYGAACLTLCGVSMITTSVTYHLLSPQYPIRMSCGEEHLALYYGWCFWSVLVFGILTTIVGLVLFLLEHKVPEKMAEFFVIEKSFEDTEEFRQANTDGKWTPDRRDSPNMFWQGLNPDRSDSPGLKRPVNWHINYGHDSQRQIDNPAYRETEGHVGTQQDGEKSVVQAHHVSEVSKNYVSDTRRISEQSNSSRGRSFSSIAEEDESPVNTNNAAVKPSTAGGSSSPSVGTRKIGAHDLHVQTIDRLTSIYVDVEEHVEEHTHTRDIADVHRL